MSDFEREDCKIVRIACIVIFPALVVHGLLFSDNLLYAFVIVPITMLVSYVLGIGTVKLAARVYRR